MFQCGIRDFSVFDNFFHFLSVSVSLHRKTITVLTGYCHFIIKANVIFFSDNSDSHNTWIADSNIFQTSADLCFCIIILTCIPSIDVFHLIPIKIIRIYRLDNPFTGSPETSDITCGLFQICLNQFIGLTVYNRRTDLVNYDKQTDQGNQRYQQQHQTYLSCQFQPGKMCLDIAYVCSDFVHLTCSSLILSQIFFSWKVQTMQTKSLPMQTIPW